MPRLKCPNPKCNLPHARKAKFCTRCGTSFAEHHHTIMGGLFHFLFHFNRKIFQSFVGMISKPGRTLYCLVREKGKYQDSLFYFGAAVGLHHFIGHFIFEKLHFRYQLSSQLGDHIVDILILLVLLSIMALIGYITLGWWKVKPGNVDDYSFSDVFVICLYIYGTNYFLAPVVVAVSQLFNGYFDSKNIGEIEGGKITDIPLAIFMEFVLFRLVMNTPSYKFRYFRFGAFLILSYTYYFFAFDYIAAVKHYFHTGKWTFPIEEVAAH